MERLLKNQMEITEKRQRNRMEIMQMQNQKMLKTPMIQKRQMHLTTRKAAIQKINPKHLTAKMQTAKLRKNQTEKHRMVTVRLPVWTVMMRPTNTAQMKLFLTHPWNPQAQTKTQHLFLTAQKLHSTMMQSPEHLLTARVVTTPASMA